MSSELRAPTLDDLPGLVRLDAGRFNGMTERQFRERLSSPRSNSDQNWRVATSADGEIVGGVFIWHPEPASHRVFFHVATNPEDGELYERLLDWCESRARELTGGTGRLHAAVAAAEELVARTLRGRGYEVVRHFFTMEIELDQEPAEPEWPEGITARAFEPGEERALYDVDMEAFQDHWDFFEIPFEEWRDYFLASSEFDPGLWSVACDGDQVAGTALCSWEGRPGIGRVNVLAVRRPWRRRGLGHALLLRSFRAFYERGRTTVDLNVDAENLTGAVGLYERAGMHVAHREDTYRKDF
jgi:mycothiol synthase